MTKQDATMFGLYLFAVGVGAVMVSGHGEGAVAGFIQMAVISALFGWRLYRVTNKKRGI
jgi:hypothetical protein